jgi:hypothetical protein
MDQKALISNVVTAVVTAGVLGVIGWAMGVFSAGSDALNEAQIKAVVEEVLIRDTGATYAASLASIDVSIGQINTSIGAIKEDIDDLEDSVGILAAE